MHPKSTSARTNIAADCTSNFFERGFNMLVLNMSKNILVLDVGVATNSTDTFSIRGVSVGHDKGIQFFKFIP